MTSVIFQDINTVISAGAVDGNIKVWDLRKNYSTIRAEPLPYHAFPYPGSGTRKHGENTWYTRRLPIIIARKFKTFAKRNLYTSLKYSLIDFTFLTFQIYSLNKRSPARLNVRKLQQVCDALVSWHSLGEYQDELAWAR